MRSPALFCGCDFGCRTRRLPSQNHNTTLPRVLVRAHVAARMTLMRADAHQQHRHPYTYPDAQPLTPPVDPHPPAQVAAHMMQQQTLASEVEVLQRTLENKERKMRELLAQVSKRTVLRRECGFYMLYRLRLSE